MLQRASPFQVLRSIICTVLHANVLFRDLAVKHDAHVRRALMLALNFTPYKSVLSEHSHCTYIL